MLAEVAAATPKRDRPDIRRAFLRRTAIKLVTTINAATLDNASLIAESNEFAVYDIGRDTYALVHRHAGVEWQAITISGDGVFRVLELLSRTTRTLYRDVAADLSKQKHSA